MNRNYICPIIRPSKTVRNKLAQAFGSARWMYNKLIEEHEADYQAYLRGDLKKAPSVSHFTLVKRTKHIRRDTEWYTTGYPGGVPIHNCVSENLASVYKKYFDDVKKKKEAHKPRFKSKHGKKSFQFYCDHRQKWLKREKTIYVNTQGNAKVHEICKIKLVNIGWIRIDNVPSWVRNEHITKVTIKQKGTRYYATLHCDMDPSEIKNLRPYSQKRAVGVDVGCKALAATSDGVMYSRENLWRRRELLKQCQSKLSKAKNEGRDPEYINKLRQRIGNLHAKIERIQRDFSHKVSTTISENQVVVVEDLDVMNMIGTSKDLNRMILEAGMSGFLSMLADKVKARGGKLIKVDPAYTSRRCSVCGHTCKRNRQSQENFLCVKCGHAENADVNAAKNILTAGGAGVTA